MAAHLGTCALSAPTRAFGERRKAQYSYNGPVLQFSSEFLGRTQRTGLVLRHAKASCRRSSQVTLTRAALGSKQLTVDVEKPLGLKFKELNTEQGGLIVTDASGNAAKAGIQKGDTVIYTSSFFGDELWPSDSANFARTALAKAPSPVCIVYVKGTNESIMVKRLPKKNAPPRFGKTLTPSQRELATHICLDCGYVYCQKKPFEDLSPESYRCPQCQAPKKRFAAYDVESGKPKGGFFLAGGTVATLVGGLVGIGLLFYLGLKI